MVVASMPLATSSRGRKVKILSLLKALSMLPSMASKTARFLSMAKAAKGLRRAGFTGVAAGAPVAEVAASALSPDSAKLPLVQ